ncbi:alpha/beta hydrolase family protein [Marinobacter sp. 71-i]|uniref:Alpha/beta hydrolase family protein n=1 Tax=Marinobacter iranensis TaxID=2962607 RepID=A0ABT5Y6S4_9GAMM|nr:DUF3530 family protein [Marinobacter iranensis]MDF0749371.1 alpha/beta hydrolase family protein [Marinobacter iranensis]
MSKWFEKPVMRFLVILASMAVFGLSSALAQAPEDARDKNAETAGQESEKPAAAAVERAMISTGLDSGSIARNWPEAAVWLEPPEEDRVLALFEPEASTPAKGALLVLANEGQSPASGLARALRQPMARDGWAVMTLGLEAPPYAIQQARRLQARAIPEEAELPGSQAEETGNEPADESESVMIDVMDSVDVEELANQYRTRVQKSLAVAVSNLVDRGYGRIAVAGIGRAAGHVTRMAAATGSGDVSALIWIAPEFDQGDSRALAEWLAGAGTLKVLELHSSRRPPESGGTGTRSPRQREAALKRAEVAGYSRQPVAMSSQPEPREAPALANRISAWLEPDR